MSSCASVLLDDGREICSFRNEVDQLFFILFTQNDWFEATCMDAVRLASWRYEDEPPEDAKLVGFRLTARTIRERLDVLGVDSTAVADVLMSHVSDNLEMKRAFETDGTFPEDMVQEIHEENVLLAGISFDAWVESMRAGLLAGESISSHGTRGDLGSARWLMSLWDYSDPGTCSAPYWKPCPVTNG